MQMTTFPSRHRGLPVVERSAQRLGYVERKYLRRLSNMRWLIVVFVTGFASTFNSAVAGAAIDVVIDLSRQTMTVNLDDSFESYSWKVSTARPGYRTPVGTFKPQWLARMHYSRLYDNSPMPYSIFFKGNFAIHGTEYVKRLGRPASHGCVRLAPANAKILFGLVKDAGMENVTIRVVP